MSTFVHSCSCEEPDEKRVHGEEAALVQGQMTDGDMQANQAAYNYNAWYQVTHWTHMVHLKLFLTCYVTYEMDRGISLIFMAFKTKCKLAFTWQRQLVCTATLCSS